MWVSCKDRQPPRQGLYRVMRKAFRPSGARNYEDQCYWLMPDIIADGQPAGYWANRDWVIINTVYAWREAED